MSKPNKSWSRENPGAKPLSTSRSSAARSRPRSFFRAKGVSAQEMIDMTTRNELTPTKCGNVMGLTPKMVIYYSIGFMRCFSLDLFLLLSAFDFFSRNDRKPTYRKISGLVSAHWKTRILLIFAYTICNCRTQGWKSTCKPPKRQLLVVQTNRCPQVAPRSPMVGWLPDAQVAELSFKFVPCGQNIHDCEPPSDKDKELVLSL